MTCTLFLCHVNGDVIEEVKGTLWLAMKKGQLQFIDTNTYIDIEKSNKK